MSEPTRIHLLRHGLTEWNELRRFQGRSNIPLNDKGVAQAERVADALSQVEWDIVFSSPLERAMQTARIVVGNRALDIQQVEGLVEMDLGALEGRMLAELSDDERAVLAQWRVKPSLVSMPGGEGLAEVQERVVESLVPLIEENSSKRILVVGHAFSLLTYICAAIELELDQLRSLFLDPLGLTTLEVHSDRVLLRGFNHVVDSPYQ